MLAAQLGVVRGSLQRGVGACHVVPWSAVECHVVICRDMECHIVP